MTPARAAPGLDAAVEREYILGTDANELFRLGLQHRLFSADTCALWDRAGFAPGQTILDVGCGPGHVSFDLSQLVGPNGRVIAVDVSQRFVDHLKQQQTARGIANIDARVEDVQSMKLHAASVDRAYVRWVLCFVPDPFAVVSRVAEALRPGGRFAIQDYVRYRNVLVSPPSPEFDRVFEAADASWRAHGGDSQIGLRIPAMLTRAGFRVDEVRPLVRTARPGEPLWHWPTTFFQFFIPRLVEGGYLTRADQEAFDRVWAERSRDPTAFFVSPPMVEIIATRV